MNLARRMGRTLRRLLSQSLIAGAIAVKQKSKRGPVGVCSFAETLRDRIDVVHVAHVPAIQDPNGRTVVERQGWTPTERFAVGAHRDDRGVRNVSKPSTRIIEESLPQKNVGGTSGEGLLNQRVQPAGHEGFGL